MNPTVSIVIASLNGRNLLGPCLRSLWDQTFTDFEVIVVDNGSTDGTVDFIKSFREPRLRMVSLSENRGFAGGCNAGMTQARGRYIATLNNDTEADRNWLGELVRVMDGNPKVGMGASKILFFNERNRIDKAGHLIYLDGVNHGRGSGQLDQGQFDRIEDVLFPDGAAAIYRREMLDMTGLFDDRFFAYGDDCDLGLRGRLAGWGCLYVPTAVVYHVHSATSGEFSSLKAFLIERNRIWVAVKSFPAPLLLVSPIFTMIRFAFHAYGSLFGVGSSGRFAARSRTQLVLAILKAYWSAVKSLPAMWSSRRAIGRSSHLSAWQFTALLWKNRISTRSLTLGT